MAFKICSPGYGVIQLFHSRDDISHVECDTDNMYFPLGNDMGLGYLWTYMAFEIRSLDT